MNITYNFNPKRTNRESALSPNGVQQVEELCNVLRQEKVNPTVLRYSLAAAAMDTADIVGKEIKIGRNNLVPEFNFMDPRAIGKWDMLPLSSTQKAVWAMDQIEAGNDGLVRCIFGSPFRYTVLYVDL